MTAEEAREELEAKLHRLGFSAASVRAVLAEADVYAECVADERIAGRKRLAKAAAERSGKRETGNAPV